MITSCHLKNPAFIILIFCALFCGYGFFYEGWWKFIPSTLAIVALTRFFYSSKWQTILGWPRSFSAVIVAFASCLIFTLIFQFTIAFSLGHGYGLITRTLMDYVVVPFQSLNEELVFRALFISGLLSLGLRGWKLVLFPSLVFSLAHLAFYYVNDIPENQGILGFSALLTLFCFAVSANVIFVTTNSVLIPWALHCAWNFNRFGSRIIDMARPDETIGEYQTFNLLEGSQGVLAISILSALIITYLCRDRIARIGPTPASQI